LDYSGAAPDCLGGDFNMTASLERLGIYDEIDSGYLFCLILAQQFGEQFLLNGVQVESGLLESC